MRLEQSGLEAMDGCLDGRISGTAKAIPNTMDHHLVYSE
jgi:hypothetical protein